MTDQSLTCPRCFRPNLSAKAAKSHKTCEADQSLLKHLVSDSVQDPAFDLAATHAEPWQIKVAIEQAYGDARKARLDEILRAKEPQVIDAELEVMDAASSRADRALERVESSIAFLDNLHPVQRPPADPAAPMTLAEIEEQVRAFDTRINEATREYQNQVIYDIVSKGLFLLKGEAHYLLLAQPETVSGKSRKRNDKGELQAQEGFTAWLEKLGMNERTARNYRNAARNCGLTSDHSVADVETMRAQLALHEKKPTDLYRLQAPATPPPAPEPEAPVDLAAQAFANLMTAMGEVAAAKDQMAPDDYETCWRALQESLEAFTGREWEMTDRPRAVDASTHGELIDDLADMQVGKVKKSGKGKGASK